MQQPTVEQIADVSQFREQTVEVWRLVPRERVQRRISEHIVEVPLPRNTEDVVHRAARTMREAAESRRAFECPLLQRLDPSPIKEGLRQYGDGCVGRHVQASHWCAQAVNRTPTRVSAHHTAQSDHFSSREHAWLKFEDFVCQKRSVIHASCLVPCRT